MTIGACITTLYYLVARTGSSPCIMLLGACVMGSLKMERFLKMQRNVCRNVYQNASASSPASKYKSLC